MEQSLSINQGYAQGVIVLAMGHSFIDRKTKNFLTGWLR